jgi:hypothetical protein
MIGLVVQGVHSRRNPMLTQTGVHTQTVPGPQGPQPSDTIRLVDCSAAEAISKWLDGDYQCGEEYALLVAIRRQAPTDLTDCEIKDLIHEASERGRGVAAVLTKLLDPAAREAGTPDRDARDLRPHS